MIPCIECDSVLSRPNPPALFLAAGGGAARVTDPEGKGDSPSSSASGSWELSRASASASDDARRAAVAVSTCRLPVNALSSRFASDSFRSSSSSDSRLLSRSSWVSSYWRCF